LGDGCLLNKIKGFIRGKEVLKEIPRVQRYIMKPSLEDILRYEDKKERGKAIFEAHIRYGYTLKEVAGHIGVHYTTVSRAVNRIEEK
jgi:DNA-binding MarR family transcriptional regulator